ncbi:MAG: hypothetical protein WBC22_09420, partial [Sedimentisphaerales bacterium]
MRSAKKLTILVLGLGLMVWQAEVSKAAPMGTALTYQGRLMDANNVADGLYDFEFRLYQDPNSGGFQIAPTAVVDDHDVIDGYFTVELDFGQYAFNGDARWLEIAVRPGDSNDVHTILSPRQQVTPTPYAIRAHIADSSADGVTGSGTTNQLAKFTATKVVSDSAIYETGGNVGIGTTSPESRLQIEQSAGAWGEGIRLSYGDHTWDIVTDYEGERLTFAPDQDSTKGLVMRNGNAGFGTANPSSKLNIAQDSSAWVEGIRLTYGGYDWDIVSSGERLLIAPNQTITEGIVITNGKVGIGTGSPEEELHVEGDARISGDLWVQDDLTVTGQYSGSFPRPAYDSGWVGILQGNTITLNHNLVSIGYDEVDNYVVD